MQGYSVKLDGFEGPLDLLLHLINRYEIDIYDIPVAVITEQYMHYIHTMQQLELNIASEYLVMAASLLALKSQMLLPNQPIDEEEELMEEDPREELVNKLIEYRKFKEAAADLKEKETAADKLYTREPQPLEEPPALKPLTPGEVTVYDMVAALQQVFQRKTFSKPLDTKVQRAEIPIEERMGEVLTALQKQRNGIAFHKLFPVSTKQHIVVTFMAVLELMKKKQVYCTQEKHFDELMVFSLHEAV